MGTRRREVERERAEAARIKAIEEAKAAEKAKPKSAPAPKSKPVKAKDAKPKSNLKGLIDKVIPKKEVKEEE